MLNVSQPAWVCNPEAIRHCVARDGLTPMNGAVLPAAGELAGAAVGPSIVRRADFLAVDAISGCTAFAHMGREGFAGALAVIPLRNNGLEALRADRFNGVQPDLDLVARPGEAAAAIYGWGIVGSGPRSRAAVLRAVDRLRRELTFQVPWYCRAATDDGARVILGRLGYAPVPGSASGLFVSEPLSLPLRRAA